MKRIFFRILRIMLYPLAYCRQVILDAPIVDCGEGLMGYGDFRRFSAADDPCDSKKQDTGLCRNAGIWVRHAH